MKNEVTLPREEISNVEILFKKRYYDKNDELERKYKRKEATDCTLLFQRTDSKNTPKISKK